MGAFASDFQTGEDVAALRALVGLAQADFAALLGISLRTLRNGEQNRNCHPRGPALAVVRIAARHPRIIRENLASAT